MTAWWESLSILEQAFACIAVPATIVLLIQTVLLLIGLGHDGQADIAVETDVDGDLDLDTANAGDGVFGESNMEEYAHDVNDHGLRLFSVRTIVAFFTVMGWTGLVISRGGGSPAWAIAGALLAGVAAMFLMAIAMRAFTKLQTDGNIDIRHAIGKDATVYLTIPAQRGGMGKVHMVLQNTYSEWNAVTDEPEPLVFDTPVVVTAIVGESTLVVARK